MTVRKVSTEVFYPTLKEWWTEHNFPLLGLDFLPQTVFVCYSGFIATHAILFYNTDSGLCWIAFPTSNPFLESEAKDGGLETLLKGVSEYAKVNNYQYIFTTSPVEKVKEALLKTGFNLGDENVNHYLKIT